MDQARYQIIGKVPFRDVRGTVMTAQERDDPDYPFYLTAQDLTQAYGRPNRAELDFAETWIVDDSIEWFLRKYSGYNYDSQTGKFNLSKRKNGHRYFSEYFLEAFERVDRVTDPPPLETIAVGDRN